MKLVKVILKKNGKEIEVLPREVLQLRNAGLLKEGKAETTSKEEKGKTQTKEEKNTGKTKLEADTKTDNETDGAGEGAESGEGSDEKEPPKDEQAARERMYPKSNRPVNISSKNINKGG